MRELLLTLCIAFLSAPIANAATDVPVPTACTPQVNQQLGSLIKSPPRQNVDNIMVCGIAIRKSRTQSGGPHGDHQILAIKSVFPGGNTAIVEVVTNDDLDGKVTAMTGDAVFAFGQAFIPRRGQYSAGVHDVHCSTHQGADNGWVVVNGSKSPTTCSTRR